MKVLSVILSLYLLGLAFLPCNPGPLWGADPCQDEKCAIGSETQQDPLEDCSDEPCTLLCDCTCCANVLNLTELLVFEDIEPARPVTVLPQYQKIEGILSCIDIWQPPKSI